MVCLSVEKSLVESPFVRGEISGVAVFVKSADKKYLPLPHSFEFQGAYTCGEVHCQMCWLLLPPFEIATFTNCFSSSGGDIRTSMESGTDTVRSDTTSNRPMAGSKRTLSVAHYTGGYHSAESDMDLSPTDDDGKIPKKQGSKLSLNQEVF